MSLTSAQLATFKAAALAETDPTLVAARTAQAWQTIANFYNVVASPPVALWRPSVGVDELKNAVVWSEFLALTVAKQNAWFALTQGEAVDATNANIRAGFGAVFGGQTITNLTAVAQRNATRFEALFTANGASSLFGYSVSDSDAAQALS